MTKLTLQDVTAVQNQTSLAATINQNSEAIEDAIENTISRDGTTPNTMGADLDMNSHRIINLPTAININEAVTLGQVIDYLGGVNPEDLQTAVELVQEDREATEEARDIALAAAAAAQTFDPSSYYPKADFKAQGTADAPAKYDSSGNLLANSLYLDKPLGNLKGVIWRTSGVLRMAMQLNATDVFQLTAYDDSGVIIGDILTADRATRTVTFGVIPKIAGIVKGDLLVGIADNALGVLSGGSTGQILTKQADGSLAWSAAPSGGVSLDVGVGNIGSFYYGCTTGQTSPGSTVAGSTLRGPQSAYLNSGILSVGIPENPSLSGTWRSLQRTSLGDIGDSASRPTKPGLFQRII